jgi:hypothetical protein
MLGKLGIDEIDAILSANVTGRIGCTDGGKSIRSACQLCL